MVVALLSLLTIDAGRTAAQRSAEDDETVPVKDPLFADDARELSTTRSKPLSPEALRALLAHYAGEPRVEDVVAAALRVARAAPDHFADLAGRSRLRGLIPHLDVGARRGQGIDLRWAPTDDLAENRTTADDVMLFATLRFDLDRLMFSSDEVTVAREARYAQHEHAELIRRVVHVYYLRRRLLLERDLLGSTSIAAQLRIEEAEALLNAFTDGAFERMLKHDSWKTDAGTNASARPSPPSSN